MASSWADGKTASLNLAIGAEAVTPREFVCRAYEQERDVIYRYLVAIGTEPHAAQELTQEAFLKLYVAVRKGKRIHSVRAWMFTVASNLALNQRRAESYRPTISADDAAAWMDTLADPGSDPEKAVLQRERAVALQHAIGSLSAQQQICLHLRAEGFRYREIARMIGVSVPTVSEFIRRAIARLRNVIHEWR